MSLDLNEFVYQVYTQRDNWDCLATCFFIDCANNVAEFVENIFKYGQWPFNFHVFWIQYDVVYRILKPGGIWVNLGPLLYHYSDVQCEGSIEPTYEDLLLIIRAVGFEILVSLILNEYKLRFSELKA